MQTDLLILGLKDGATALDVARIAARAARPDFAAGLRRAKVESFARAARARAAAAGRAARAAASRGPRPHAPAPAPQLPRRAAASSAARRPSCRSPASARAAQAGARELAAPALDRRAGSQGASPTRSASRSAEQACTNRWPLCAAVARRLADAARPSSRGRALREARWSAENARARIPTQRPRRRSQSLLLDGRRRGRDADRPRAAREPALPPLLQPRAAVLDRPSRGALEALHGGSPGACTEGRRRTQKLVQQGVGEKVAEHAKAR